MFSETSFNLFGVFRWDFVTIFIFIFQFKTLLSFLSVTKICRWHISSINTSYVLIGRQFFQFLKVKKMSVPKTEGKSSLFHIGNEFPNIISITWEVGFHVNAVQLRNLYPDFSQIFLVVFLWLLRNSLN